MEADRSGARQLAVRLDLTDAELELVRTALRLLEDTLGHEEAAELDEVQELIARLPPAPGAGRPSGDGRPRPPRSSFADRGRTGPRSQNLKPAAGT